jgi:hypothetical protein
MATPEDLTWAGQPLAIEGVANPAGAVNGGMPGWVGQSSRFAWRSAVVPHDGDDAANQDSSFRSRSKP